MKTPVVDYRRFRLSRLKDPEFAHLKLLWGWVVYFILYFLTENGIPPERCHPMHCALDDQIPFCEWFVIPYVAWYGMIVFSLVWFGLYDIGSFRSLSIYITVTQVIAMAAYILLPSRQDLRPQVFPRENLCTALVAFLYAIDTNTGVCPSLHVAYSLAMASVWTRAREVTGGWKWLIWLFLLTVCLSTMLIKQHSALDVLAALPVCLAAELLVFGRGGALSGVSGEPGP